MPENMKRKMTDMMRGNASTHTIAEGVRTRLLTLTTNEASHSRP